MPKTMCGKDYPSAYQDGYADFYYERYKVTEGVLIPRPDTELLVEAALMLCGALECPMGDVMKLKPVISAKKISLIDLCAGTGCVGISTANALVSSGREVELAEVDISDDALACVRDNSDICLTDVNIIKADILSGDADLGLKADIITSNPPYVTDQEMTELPKSVTYEPELALRGGADGMMFYGRLCSIGNSILNDGGVLVVEHGYRQQEQVIKVFEDNGYTCVTGLCDYGGNPRVTAGIRRSYAG